MGYTTLTEMIAGRELPIGTTVSAKGQAATQTGNAQAFIGSHRVRDTSRVDNPFPENEAARFEHSTVNPETGVQTDVFQLSPTAMAFSEFQASRSVEEQYSLDKQIQEQANAFQATGKGQSTPPTSKGSSQPQETQKGDPSTGPQITDSGGVSGLLLAGIVGLIAVGVYAFYG